MRRSRVLLKWFIFFVIAAIFVLVRSKCVKAEAAPSEAPWDSQGSIFVTPIPFEPPQLPDPTPIPDSFFNIENVYNVYRQYERGQNLQRTQMMYKPYTINRVGTGNSYVFNDISLTGATYTSNNPYWMPNYQDVLTGEDFRDELVRRYKNQYTFSSYTSHRPVNFKTGSFAWSFLDAPYVTLDRGCLITYYFSFDGCGFTILNSPACFSTLGIDNSWFDDFECTIVVKSLVEGDDYDYEYWYAHQAVTTSWSKLRAGQSIDISLAFMEDNETLEQNFVTVCFDPKYSNNPVYQATIDYYIQNDTPLADRIYGTYGLFGTGITFSRNVLQTEDKHKMTWFEKLFFPDPEWVASYLDDFVDDLNGNATVGWALAYRGLIYNWLSGNHADFIIYVPSLNVLGYQFFDGYTFNVTQFFSQKALASLMQNLHLVINILITMAFLNHIVTAVFGFFGLKLYSGVTGSDIGEGDD